VSSFGRDDDFVLGLKEKQKGNSNGQESVAGVVEGEDCYGGHQAVDTEEIPPAFFEPTA
jgi:hypothetical protein